jgi:hypothetical protein
VSGRLRNFAKLLTGTVFAVLLLEAAVRIADPFDTLEFVVDDELLWRYRPNQIGRVTEYGILKDAPVATINALGFRGRDPVAGDPRPRILFLGDSATFGVGVADRETYSALVQGLTGDCVVSFNAGVGGWGVFQYEALLRRVAETLPARFVVVDLGTGSTAQRQPFATDAEREAYLRPRRLLNAIREHSRLALFLGRPAHRLWMMFTERRAPTEAVTTGSDLASFYRKLEANMQRLATMRDMVASHGGEFVVVVWPGRFAHNEAFVRTIRNWGRESGVAVIDLSAALGTLDEWQWRIPRDWHPNALGHRIAAREIHLAIAGQAPRDFRRCKPRTTVSVGP